MSYSILGSDILVKTLSVGILGLSNLHPRSYTPIFRAVPDFEVAAAAEANSRCPNWTIQGRRPDNRLLASGNGHFVAGGDPANLDLQRHGLTDRSVLRHRYVELVDSHKLR